MNKTTFAFVGLISCCLLSCSDDNACFSPTSNVSSAGQPGVVGCACNPAVDKDVCIQGGALLCWYGQWYWGVDGPCMPIADGGSSKDTALDANASLLEVGPATETAAEANASLLDVGEFADTATEAPCYSPTSNPSPYQPGAVGCACDPAVDKAVCIQGHALFCTYGHWGWGEDGPCMPGPDGGAPKDAAMDSALPALDSGGEIVPGGLG